MIIIKEGLITVGAAIPYSFKNRHMASVDILKHDLIAAAHKIEEQTKEDEEYEQTELWAFSSALYQQRILYYYIYIV